VQVVKWLNTNLLEREYSNMFLSLFYIYYTFTLVVLLDGWN
jgi:hypothetical protein